MIMSGRSLQESMMMMIPEAWQADQEMDQKKRDFYEFNSAVMEPWDGPASIVFTDGDHLGAVLDRNGLRPSRYYVTTDDRVIMASEVGVVSVDPAHILLKGRLQPGKMFLLDFEQGRLIPDAEIKQSVSNQNPYGDWLEAEKITLASIAPKISEQTFSLDSENLIKRMRSFGYTTETMEFMLIPLITEARDPLGSMGNDSALACLSDKPRMIYDYFKQLFAQVTNPPLDGIREEIVTDTSLSVGKEFNLFDITPSQAKKLSIQNPVISNEDLDKIKFIEHPDFKAETISTRYEVSTGLNSLENALEDMIKSIEKAVDKGANIIILSDRGVSPSMAPIPILLSTSHTHHAFKRLKKRSKFGIIIESAEPREPHHFALLFGYGASAINPYMVNEIIAHQVETDVIKGISVEKAISNFNKAIAKGIVKVMNKIGISTLHSYRGAQIFEALGLNEKFIDIYFCKTAFFTTL